MRSFTYEALPGRVVFGVGASREKLAEEVVRLGAERVLLVVTEREKEFAEELAAPLGDRVVDVFTDVRPHVPVEVAGAARDLAEVSRADCLLSVGGGSTTGTAKAIALEEPLPIVAVPTTYAGSEATDVWGLTEHGRKTTGTDRRVLPRAVVYDASLLLSLPADASVASGLNALAHCVDSMWAPRVDPIDQALALEGVRVLSQGLPRVAADPEELEGRERSLFGAYLAAVAFASAGSGLHHKICHTLGGLYNLPHAQTHAVVLPHVLALNAPAVPEVEQRLAAAFGAPTAIEGLRRLRRRLNAPRALRDYGLGEEDIPAAVAALEAAVPPANPTPVSAATLERLLSAALNGEEP